MSSDKEFIYVDTESELLKASKIWDSCTELGIDLECENNLHHYGSYISLVQISNSTRHWIVDALKLKDKKMLIDMLTNKDIMKIFHDVSFDLRIIYEELGCRTLNIFDTQIAAILVGKKDIGLKSLLKEYFDIDKADKYQMADWTRRPLKPNMLQYATKDSRYLIRLKAILEEELEKLGRTQWALEEFRLLEEMDLSMKRFEYTDVKGYSVLSDKERAILKRLFDMRESMAKKANRPVHFIMNNKILKKLSVDPPRSIEEWENLKGVHPIVHRFAKSFYLAVEKGKEEKIGHKNKKRWYYTQKEKELLNDLSDQRTRISEKLGIEKHVILNKDQMRDIVLNQNTDSLKDWQKKFLDVKFE